MRRYWWWFLAGALLLVSCGGRDDGADSSPSATALVTGTPGATSAPAPIPTPSPWPESGPSASPAPTSVAVPGYPRGTRTGRPAIDAIIDAAERQDGVALEALTLLSEYPCQEPLPIQPQPLLCPDGMKPGEILRGLFVSHVEWGLWGPHRDPRPLSEELRGIIGPGHRLYGVYDFGAEVAPSPVVPARRYIVSWARALPSGYVEYDSFALNPRGQLVAIHFAFPEVPEPAWSDRSDPGWLLPPPP